MQQLTSLLMYSLYAPVWTARKLDKKATKEVKDANNVKETLDVGNFNKLVLPDCTELEKIQSYIGQVRQAFYMRTAPWGETRGVRVGKAEHHMDLLSWFGDQKAGLEPLLDAFGAVYASKVQAMEYEMNGLFNPDDYPSWDVVRSKFDLQLRCTPLPNAADVRVLTEIPQHIRDELEAEIKAEQEKVHNASMAHAYGELLKPVAHMARQLKAYQDGSTKRIFTSLVENVREMAEAVRRLNIARDPALDALADDAAKLVDGVASTEDLKKSDGFRSEKIKAAEELAARIGKLMPLMEVA